MKFDDTLLTLDLIYLKLCIMSSVVVQFKFND